MFQKQNKALIYSVFIFFALAYILFYFCGQSAVQTLYQKSCFNLLNKLTDSHQDQSLNYYLGKIENTFLGPIKSLLSGSLFLLFAYQYLRQATFFRFTLAVFVYLILTRPEVLSYPPYGESITGPFSDAIWLTQNNLNYVGLLHQDTFAKGGPQIYPLSIYPLFLSLLMKLSVSSIIFLVVIHLIVFLLGAFIITIIKELATELWDERVGILTAILFLSLPLFQSMVELINLEIPNVFFAIFSIYFLSKRKYLLSCLCAIMSVLIKVTGFIVCISVLAAMIIHLFIENKNERKEWSKNLVYATVTFIFATAIGFLRNKIIGAQPFYNKVALFIGWPCLKTNLWFWIYLTLLVFFLIEMGLSIKKSRTNQVASKYLPIAVFFLTALLWFFMYLNFTAIAYRYELLLAVFLIFCIIHVLHYVLGQKKIILSAMTILILISFISSHGLVYALTGIPAINPTELERSLEYRNYLKADRLTVQEIIDRYANYTIVAPFGMAEELSLPMLGYNHQNLDIQQYGMRTTLGIKPFEGIDRLDLKKTIYVGYTFDKLKGYPLAYPFDPGKDRLVKKIFWGDQEVLIFKGGSAINQVYVAIKLTQKGLMDAFKNNSLSQDFLRRALAN